MGEVGEKGKVRALIQAAPEQSEAKDSRKNIFWKNLEYVKF